MPKLPPPIEHRFKPGQSGNPAGKPKGTKSLANIVRELEKEDFDYKHVPIKDLSRFKEIGSPWRAIVSVMIGQAMTGNVKAAEWLRKSGYGDTLRYIKEGQDGMPPEELDKMIDDLDREEEGGGDSTSQPQLP